MAEREWPSGPRGLGRLRAPDPQRPPRSDRRGKRALYSVDPDAEPPPPVVVRCRRCAVERGITWREARSLLRPPFLLSPVCRAMWTRCPTCERRTWLRIRRGPGIPWPLRPGRGSPGE